MGAWLPGISRGAARCPAEVLFPGARGDVAGPGGEQLAPEVAREAS